MWGARATAVSSNGDIPGSHRDSQQPPWLCGPFALLLSRRVEHQSFQDTRDVIVSIAIVTLGTNVISPCSCHLSMRS